jgi:hypothetical protein
MKDEREGQLDIGYIVLANGSVGQIEDYKERDGKRVSYNINFDFMDDRERWYPASEVEKYEGEYEVREGKFRKVFPPAPRPELPSAKHTQYQTLPETIDDFDF